MVPPDIVLLVFLALVLPAIAGIVAIVGGWIADYREARRIRRIFAEREP